MAELVVDPLEIVDIEQVEHEIAVAKFLTARFVIREFTTSRFRGIGSERTEHLLHVGLNGMGEEAAVADAGEQVRQGRIEQFTIRFGQVSLQTKLLDQANYSKHDDGGEGQGDAEPADGAGQIGIEKRPGGEQGKDESDGSSQASGPAPVVFAVGISVFGDGIEAIGHEGGDGHAAEATGHGGVIPTAGKVKLELGKGVNEILHDGVEGDDGSEQGVEIAPLSEAAEPAVENDGKQNHVLAEGEILIGGAVGLRIREKVLPRDDEIQIEVKAPQQEQEQVKGSEALMFGGELDVRAQGESKDEGGPGEIDASIAETHERRLPHHQVPMHPEELAASFDGV